VSAAERRPDDLIVHEIGAKPTAGDLDDAAEPPAPGVPLWLAILVAALALVCVGAGGVAWAVRGRDEVRRVVVDPSVSRGVNAGGCPVGVVCAEWPNSIVLAYNAILASWPAADVQPAQFVVDEQSTRLYRASVTARTPDGVRISLSMQCVPSGTALPDRSDPLPARGPAEVLLVRGTSSGCSVVVLADVPAGVAVPGRQLMSVLATPGLRR
jgi:hypothetical protein